ncbi:hypothetical protein D9M71_441400 [compost metagenome]
MLTSELQQAVSHLWGQAAASGVVIQTVDVQATRPMALEQVFQYLQVRACGGTRHQQHFDLMLAQQVVQVVVPRAFHHDLVARLEQGSHQQVESMTGALGRKDLLGTDLDTDLPQDLVQLSAQTGQPQRWTVVEQIFHRPTADVTHSLGDRFGSAPAGRHPATTQIEQIDRGIAELLPAIGKGFIAKWLINQCST